MQRSTANDGMLDAGGRLNQQTMREYTTSETDLATRSASLSPASPTTSLPTYNNNTNAPSAAATSLYTSSPVPDEMAPSSSPSPRLTSTMLDMNVDHMEMWFKPIYQQQHEEEKPAVEKTTESVLTTASYGRDAISPAHSPYTTSHNRPFVDDSHRLRYQDIEDETHSNGSEENNQQGKSVHSIGLLFRPESIIRTR